MKRHVESVHERIKPFKCKICDFRSAKKCNLKKHIESVHEDFKCKICEYKTAEKRSLKIHMQSVHEGATHIFKSSIYNYKTTNDYDIKKYLFYILLKYFFFRYQGRRLKLQSCTDVKSLPYEICGILFSYFFMVDQVH